MTLYNAMVTRKAKSYFRVFTLLLAIKSQVKKGDNSRYQLKHVCFCVVIESDEVSKK